MKHSILAASLLGAFTISSPTFAAGPGKPADAPCDGMSVYLLSLPAEPLSAAERDGLVFVREEEKLARDVYVAMAARWGHRAFTNIASSEQQHMDGVKLLLDRYAVADPAANEAPGVFANARLAALFAALVEKGQASLADAFAVGATIEDLDLSDVDHLLAAADNADVDTLMQNLAKGSRNHLRSFVSLLDTLGLSYAPQFIGAAEFQEVVTSPRETQTLLDAQGNPVTSLAAGTCDGSGSNGRPGPHR